MYHEIFDIEYALSLFSGKVGNWKDKFTGDLNELFDEVYNEKMAGSGLEFDFDI